MTVMPHAPLPACAGIGLRSPHYEAVLAQRPDVGWFEVHSENYFAEGGAPAHYLERVRADYPVSFHGVGLSLGSTDPLDPAHLGRLQALVDRFEPALVSEHLSWSSVDRRFLHDLLPLPHTREAVGHVAARIQQVQDCLGRELLVENISDYLRYDQADFSEWEFLVETARAAGCGLLLDVNNIYVNACNHGFDAYAYVDAVPPALVKEIHLAGHTVNDIDDGTKVLIDTHNRPVPAPVWDLYRHALKRLGPRPTLVEWDADLPPLAELVREAHTAGALLESAGDVPA